MHYCEFSFNYLIFVLEVTTIMRHSACQLNKRARIIFGMQFERRIIWQQANLHENWRIQTLE